MCTVLSLFLPYLFGLGYAFWTGACGAAPRWAGDRGADARDSALVLIVGLLTHYLLVLLLRRLGWALGVGAFLAVFGWVTFLRTNALILWTGGRRYFGIALRVFGVVFLFGPALMLEPVEDWDARSIWFFHAKVLFHEGSLTAGTGWAEPELRFSRVMYPKLAPVLIAQWAWVAGYWNEYFPKGAFLALLVPGLLAIEGIFSFRRIGWALALLALVFAPGYWMWNGYVDGYLALFGTVGTAYFCRWIDRRSPRDILASVVCLGVALNLKAEGAFVALAIGAGLLVHRFRLKAPFANSFRTGATREGLILLALPWVTWGIWQWIRWRWGIGSGHGLSSTQFVRRIQDGSMWDVLGTLFGGQGIALAGIPVALVLGYHRLVRGVWSWSCLLPIVVAAVYMLLLIGTYLATGYDLAWHMQTSLERTVLFVLGCLGISAALVVEKLESVAPLSADSRLYEN